MPILVVAIYLFYIALLWYTCRVWKKPLHTNDANNGNLFFSIVVPVRNEEKNIAACLHSLVHLDYPKDKYEIIIVNDHSTDATEEKSLAFKNQITWLNSLEEGKKAALAQGVDRTKFDYLVFTDGDCVLPTTWLSQLNKTFTSTQATIITSNVCVEPENSVTSVFEYLETCGLMAVAKMGFYSGLFHLGNGAALSVKKSFFQAVGGFSDNKMLASGDDVFLLKMAAERNEKMWFMHEPGCFVKTKAQPNMHSLLAQRKRWATKTSAYANAALIGIQALVLIANLLPLALWLWAVAFTCVCGLTWGLVALCIKLLTDYFYLSTLTPSFGGMVSVRKYLASSTINMVVYIYMSFNALLPSGIEWKNRKTR